MKYVLSIDQGTTSSRVIIYNSRFEKVGVGQKAFQQYFPKPGFVEHDAEEIWQSVLSSLEEALANVQDPEFSVKKIASIGITNQRETFVLWSKKTSKTLGKAIVWQDRRSADFCNKLKKSKVGKKIESLTGLVLDPYFSGTKLSLTLKEISSTEDIAFGNIDTFLLWKLTGASVHATDVTNASRTLLMNLKTLSWDPFILKTLKIPRHILPEIKDSDSEFGITKNLKLLPDGIPIHGILGDQQAALFGQSCFEAGNSKITYGTGAFMLTNTGPKIIRSKGALSTVAWKQDGKCFYALETSVFIAGAAVQWLRDGLKFFDQSSKIEALANEVKSSEGVFFIPALSGLGSPYWVPEARGLLGGITRGTTQAHIARACLEGIAHSVADTFESLPQKKKNSIIRVDGGASQNNLLMNYQSSLLQKTLERPNDVETTARGAAMMAALGAKLVTLSELKKQKDTDATYTPLLKAKEAQTVKALWNQRVEALILISKAS
jgi:glycerol kinase